MRTRHRMAILTAALGAWANHQHGELTERVGALMATKILGPGRYCRDHPKSARAGPKIHAMADRPIIGIRRFVRHARYLHKWGAFGWNAKAWRLWRDPAVMARRAAARMGAAR